MTDLIINLLANMIWVILGAFLFKVIQVFKVIRPLRKAWQITHIKELIIVAASSTFTETGEYRRPSTGIGQVRALACVIESLNKAYGTLSVKNIFLSTDQLHERLENDLILLGGPRNNEIVANYLELIRNNQPITLTDGYFCWRKKNATKWVDKDAEKLYGKTEGGKVIIDYGLIIRTGSPFTVQKRKVIMFAGSHTYGTVAAAKYFTEIASKDIDSAILKNANIAILVSTNIIDDYPVNIKLEKSYIW